jgi:flagellar motility protein MotE (MotC chaperone)
MKTGVVAILIFVAAFILTTAALIYFNTQYRNIFKFDFSPVNLSAGAVVDSTALKNKAKPATDSTKALDSLKNIANSLAPGTDSVKAAQTGANSAAQGNTNTVNNQPASQKNNQAAAKQNETNTVNNDIKTAETKKTDAAVYEKWKKNTAGIIEAMDANKASQVLRMYADNIGSELLYLMKKKKAAEILSKFDARKDSLIIRKLTRMQ